MDDLISRQDALDALMEIMDRPNHAEFLYTDEICKTLNDLPPAQPEIIRCNDCEYWQQFCNDVFGNCCFGHGVTVMEFYCRDGERRSE